MIETMIKTQPLPTVPYVFLGGDCGPTTWRQDIAIPYMETQGIAYYNPQVGVGEWHPDLESQERLAKDGAAALLFVLTSQTRGLVSMLEIMKCLCVSPERTVLVFDGYYSDHALVLDEEQVNDIKRAKYYLMKEARSQNVWPLTNILQGLSAARCIIANR